MLLQLHLQAAAHVTSIIDQFTSHVDRRFVEEITDWKFRDAN